MSAQGMNLNAVVNTQNASSMIGFGKVNNILNK